MKRRHAIKAMSITTGAGFLLPTFIGCDSDEYKPIYFSRDDLALISDLADTIIPRTSDSPGAKEVQIGNFIDSYVHDCCSLNEQNLLSNGLVQLQQKSKELYNNKFQILSLDDKINFLSKLDLDSKKTLENHYFKFFKSLVLFCYFTSKEGMEEALEYTPIPKKYIGDYPITNNQKAWAI